MTESNEQRQLKFRLINKDGEVVGYAIDRNMKDGKDDPKNDLHTFYYKHETDSMYCDYIPHTSKDQWTGIYDINGKEVYENDTVRAFDIENVKVRFKDGGFGIESSIGFMGFTRYDPLILIRAMEVIETPDREVDGG